jgi:predicted RNA-binding protein (virulence factor B family)
VAVTQAPKAILDEFAVMEVKEVTKFGVFVDWGLPKDLFVPNAEIGRRMEIGQKHLVYVCVDFRTNRLIGSNKYEDFIYRDTQGFGLGDQLDVLVFELTELGYKCLIEGKFEGLIYGNEVFKPLEIGDVVRAFVKKRRDDGKLDLQLTPFGREKYEEGAEKILEVLKVRKFLPLHDKSSPETIKEILGMSKKHFKQSIGQLYKAKRILIKEDGIELV